VGRSGSDYVRHTHCCGLGVGALLGQSIRGYRISSSLVGMRLSSSHASWVRASGRVSARMFAKLLVALRKSTGGSLDVGKRKPERHSLECRVRVLCEFPLTCMSEAVEFRRIDDHSPADFP
jgi:hypothetical protein